MSGVPRKLALAGGMGSGKTTLARTLEAEHGYFRDAYGDVIRQMLEPAYGPIDKAGSVGYGGMTGRELMQRAGAALRSVDPQIFIRAMNRRLQKAGPFRWVVDDVRTAEEAASLREYGFTVVRLVCDASVRKARLGAAWSGENDATETGTFPAVEVITDGLTPDEVLRAVAEKTGGGNL